MQALGLTEREAEAYLELFNFEEATAAQLAKVVKEHRTNIYDSLYSLVKKGLIAYSIKNGVKYFKAADPSRLIDYVKEKEEQAQEILPALQNRLKQVEDKPIVEVYEGKEGFKTILMKMLKTGKTIYGIGASEEWEKRFPIKIQQYMKEREKRRIRGKLLYTRGTKVIEHRLNEIRFLPKESSQPSTIAIFGDNVAVFMWTDPLVATVTKSRQLSKSFKKYFDVLWESSRKCDG